MRTGYLSEVKKNISIFSKRKSSNIIDGSYLSIFRGRTMNFDNLREYVPGDNVKDIDWKSSERCQTTLVRQYIAEKKHNIFIVMDAGIKMLADTATGETKKTVALYTAGTIACIANKNGDYVGLSYRHNGGIELFRQRSNAYELEAMLAHYDHDVDTDDVSDMDNVLTFLGKRLKTRSIVFIITDLAGMDEISQNTLKRLTARHDVMCIRITDATISGDAVYDLEEEEDIPSIFYNNKKLLEHEQNRVAQIESICQNKFLKSHVVSTQISSRDEITEKIVNLLGRHKNANRS